MIKLRDHEKDWLWDALDNLNGQGTTLGTYYEGDAEEDFGEMATNLIVEIIREKLLEEEENG